MFNIITVLLIILISFSVWNLRTLKRLKHDANSNVSLADDRYYELKYKIEYITTIVIVVLSVGGYFGYQWFENIKEDAAKNLSEKTKLFETKFDSINFQLKVADFRINSYNNKFTKFTTDALKIEANQKNILNKQNAFSDNLKSSTKNLANISSKIDTLKTKNILKQNFYIIEGLQYPNGNDYKKIYFKDYLTTTGDNLPSFSKVPFVSVSSPDGGGFWVSKVTTEYVEILLYMTPETNLDIFTYSLMISEQQ